MMISKFIYKVRRKFYYELNRMVHYVFSVFMKKKYLCKPLEDMLVIESHTDFDTNGGVLYDYIIDQKMNQQYKIVWLLWNKLDRKLPDNVEAYEIHKPSFKKEKILCLAKVVSTDHMAYKKTREDQTVYYLTHGAISLKSPSSIINLPDDLDFYLAPSEYMKPKIAKMYGYQSPNPRELMLGYPVQDVLYQSCDEVRKLTSGNYSKAVLWMPTFRKTKDGRVDSEKEYKFGVPLFESEDDLSKVRKLLKDRNILLIIKIHPVQDMADIHLKTDENIIVFGIKEAKKKRIDTYRLMASVDAFISDYSSAATDFMYCNKPMAYAIDDKDEYKLDFIVDDITELMGGPMITDVEGLEQFIIDVADDKDEYYEKRNEILSKIFAYHDGNSTKRVWEHMKQRLEMKK